MYIKQNGTIKNNIRGHEYFDSPEFLASSNFRSSKEHFSMKSNSSNYMIYILISIAAICIVGAGIMYYKKKQNPPSNKQIKP